MVAYKGSVADCIMICRFIDGGTNWTAAVGPAIERVTAVFGAYSSPSLETIRGRVLMYAVQISPLDILAVAPEEIQGYVPSP